MRVILFAASIAGALISCGPRTLATDPPPAPASDEPWVKEHAAAVEVGCACTDSICLEAAKAKIDRLEAEHGGLDESPADVHRSRGKFEDCYRSGTKDPVRDLEVVANKLCRCTVTSCVDGSLVAKLNYDEKYANVEMTAEQNKQIASLVEKYDECLKTKIVSGETIALHVERVTRAVCDCASGAGCGLPLTSLPDYPSAAKITDYDKVRERIKSSMETLCNCATNGAVAGTHGGINTNVACPKKDE